MNVIQDAQFRRPGAIQDGQCHDGPPDEILKDPEKSPDSTTLRRPWGGGPVPIFSRAKGHSRVCYHRAPGSCVLVELD